MTFADDDVLRSATILHTLGQDISALSVRDLEERIEMLRVEISRLEGEAAAKAETLSAADALFNR